MVPRFYASASSDAVQLTWNYRGGFGVIRGCQGSHDLTQGTTKPTARQGVSVERVTGIEPALSAWKPARFTGQSVNVCNMIGL